MNRAGPRGGCTLYGGYVVATICFLGFLICSALAQTKTGQSVSGVPINRATLNVTRTIAAGGTFEIAIASTAGSGRGPQALTIQNNNTTTDNCWVYVGVTPTLARSIRLLPGGSYVRYWPFIPSDDIRVTCDTTGNTIYVDYQ